MLASKQRLVLISAGALSLVALCALASQRLGSTPPGPSAPSSEEPPSAAQRSAGEASAPKQPIAKARALPEVRTLFEQATSAYHAHLFADDDAVVLVTQSGFVTFRPGEAPDEHAVSLGPVAARQGGSLVFWRSGRLREISLSGEGERSLAALPRPPLYLLASEGHLAWIEADQKTGYALQTLSGGDVREVYHSADGIDAAVMRGDVVYWVLQGRDGWKIGRVGLDGRHQATHAHPGRPPAMLALGSDGVYFYAGPQRGVRRLSFDLDREEAVAADVICSPLAVSSRVVCAQVGGLFELPAPGTSPRFLASEQAGPITTTAATQDRAVWVAEHGEGLVLRAVPLAAP